MFGKWENGRNWCLDGGKMMGSEGKKMSEMIFQSGGGVRSKKEIANQIYLWWSGVFY